MTLTVRRARAMAVTSVRRSPPTSVMSEAAMATSVPVPMAIPRSAWARAGASLMPSHHGHDLSLGLKGPDRLGLLARQHLGQDPVGGDADLSGDLLGRGPRVAGQDR